MWGTLKNVGVLSVMSLAINSASVQQEHRKFLLTSGPVPPGMARVWRGVGRGAPYSSVASGWRTTGLDSTVQTILFVAASAGLRAIQQPDYGRQLTNVEGELQRLECDFQASWAALLGYWWNISHCWEAFQAAFYHSLLSQKIQAIILWCQLCLWLCHPKRHHVTGGNKNFFWYQNTATKTSTITCSSIAVSAGWVNDNRWEERPEISQIRTPYILTS